MQKLVYVKYVNDSSMLLVTGHRKRGTYNRRADEHSFSLKFELTKPQDKQLITKICDSSKTAVPRTRMTD